MKMVEIGKDDELIGILKGPNSLLDGKVARIDICEIDDKLVVNLHVNMRKSSAYKDLLLKFDDIHEYSFFHSKEYSFGVIERVKFLKLDGSFYLSIDPYDDEERRLECDGDFVLSGSVVGFSIVYG